MEECPLVRTELATSSSWSSRRLRVENARLRGLLGLDTRVNDGHAVTWSPMLLTEPSRSSSVDSSSPLSVKISLLWSLFGARSDVYAVRWESASSGKSGWQPATKSRWARGRAPRDYLPLTDEVFESHVAGRETVGIYPLLRGDQCALLVCDFDRGYVGARRARVPRRLPCQRRTRCAGALPFGQRGARVGVLRRPRRSDRREGDGRGAVARSR